MYCGNCGIAVIMRDVRTRIARREGRKIAGERAGGREGCVCAWVEDFLRYWHRRPLGRAGTETPAVQGRFEEMVM